MHMQSWQEDKTLLISMPCSNLSTPAFHVAWTRRFKRIVEAVAFIVPITLSDPHYPGLSRSSFSGGCYDPIVLTPTLHGRCLDQGHCRKLSNTVCSAGRCECVIGFVPMDTNPRTGLIPGCRESSSSEGPQRFQEVGVEHCLKRFILGVQKVRSTDSRVKISANDSIYPFLQSWIPDTLIRTHHNDDRSVFSAKIYVMLNSEDTVVSIKLIDGEKSPDKLYQVCPHLQCVSK